MIHAMSILLALASALFLIDLSHMLIHLFKEPSLLKMQGVEFKLLMKFLWFFVPLILLATRKFWRRFLMLTVIFILGFNSYPAHAKAQESCEHARELLQKSGISRDAKENFMGRIKLDPPHGSFPTDIDKITWWGEFPPFEMWESPEFTALWINPAGEEVAEYPFRGTKCKLAKTTLKASSQPRGQFQDGIWQMLVTCDDFVIDNQRFAVIRNESKKTSGESLNKEESQMIWTGDLL